MSEKLKIGYFADGPWSHKAFQRLIVDDEISIKFICVRFDTKDEVLLQYCQAHNIDYIKHENVNSSEFVGKIGKYSCDLMVSMSFNQIFKSEIINSAKYKMINCHAGKLPSYKGRNVLNWVLINDEKEFGVTVHYIDEGIDTGDIILQDVHPISDSDNYETLLNRSYVACSSLLYQAICLFKEGNVVGESQKEKYPVAFYCTKRGPGDENINWNDSTRNIFNFIRAICNPGPMARGFIGGAEVKINKAEILPGGAVFKGIEGAVLSLDTKGFVVKTKDSVLRITEYSSEKD